MCRLSGALELYPRSCYPFPRCDATTWCTYATLLPVSWLVPSRHATSSNCHNPSTEQRRRSVVITRVPTERHLPHTTLKSDSMPPSEGHVELYANSRLAPASAPPGANVSAASPHTNWRGGVPGGSEACMRVLAATARAFSSGTRSTPAQFAKRPGHL